MDGLRITKLRKCSHGGKTWWAANVSLDGTTLAVTNRYGSWQTDEDKCGLLRDVLPAVAQELQAKVKTEERRETRSERATAA